MLQDELNTDAFATFRHGDSLTARACVPVHAVPTRQVSHPPPACKHISHRSFDYVISTSTCSHSRQPWLSHLPLSIPEARVDRWPAIHSSRPLNSFFKETIL
ncbi:hypothetical protein QCA50_010072 [Cerrena zonata]|uniref:Uncharacterized protein n=1 Tax=Cerrena zonata TaxID=2478898 RepID=A0AAW0GA52_9APHY